MSRNDTRHLMSNQSNAERLQRGIQQLQQGKGKPGDLLPDNSFVDVPAKPSELLQPVEQPKEELAPREDIPVDIPIEDSKAEDRKVQRMLLRNQIEKVEYEESTDTYQVYQKDYTNPTTRSLLDINDPLAQDLRVIEEYMRKKNIQRLT